MPKQSEPAFRLELRDFASAIIFIARQYQETNTVKNRSRLLEGKNQDLHQIYMKACAAFEDWPNNYYTFLNWWQTHKSPPLSSRQGLAVRMTKDFGGFYTGLRTRLVGEQFDFMRIAFMRYLKILSQGRHDLMVSEYIPMAEAIDRLKVTGKYIRYLIEVGHLKEKIVKRRGKNVHLIEVADFRKLEIDFNIS